MMEFIVLLCMALWIINIVKAITAPEFAWFKIVRIVGIFVFPLGIFLAFI